MRRKLSYRACATCGDHAGTGEQREADRTMGTLRAVAGQHSWVPSGMSIRTIDPRRRTDRADENLRCLTASAAEQTRSATSRPERASMNVRNSSQ